MQMSSAGRLLTRSRRPRRRDLRAAVVGADGFIGRHLTVALRARGTQVSAYTREHEMYWPDDPAAPEMVFYLASSVTPALAEQHPEWVTADHHRFAELVRRMAASSHPPTVVLTSSAGTVYDPDAPGPWREGAPTRATSGYGAAKLALERLLLDQAGTMPVVILRLSNVYGCGQRVDKAQGVLAYWLRAALDGDPLHLIGNPQTTRDYVYVTDVVDCMLRTAANTPMRWLADPLVLNVASGVSTSLAELLSIVEEIVGRDLPVSRLPHRAVDRRETLLDIQLAERHLGWRPRTGLVDGVTSMWQEIRADTSLSGYPTSGYPRRRSP